MSKGLLIGSLVDVSASMQTIYEQLDQPTDMQTSRVESIFRTIIQIAKRKVDDVNKEMFVLAFGLSYYRVETCDLLALLELRAQLLRDYKYKKNSYEPLIELLRENGAPHTRKYIEGYVKKTEAAFLYDYYSENKEELKDVINSLPEACKSSLTGFGTRAGTNVLSPLCKIGELFGAPNKIRCAEEEETKNQVIQAINKAVVKILSPKLSVIQEPETKRMKEIIELLDELDEGSSKQEKISSKQVKFLVETIKSFIYGRTPLCGAIKSSLALFNNYLDQDKVLFILTDGEATDGEPIQFLKEIRDQNIQVFICLITSEYIGKPRSLFYHPDRSWTREQEAMFELSSIIDNSHSAMSVLLERGWELPLEGQSKLFVQANHPDVIDEFTETVKQMADSNEVLLNIIGRRALDIYINSNENAYQVQNQGLERTCYAHAIAAVFHLAMKSIVGREGGVPEYKDLFEELKAEFGDKGANTEMVIRKKAPKYRLRFEKVEENGARRAINARRPVLARFPVYKEKMIKFNQFYQINPKGVLKVSDLITRTQTKQGGHAVVLVRCDPDCLTLMNSWGTTFADDGFFRVENQATLNLEFYDIIWHADLKESEKEAYALEKQKESKRLIDKLPKSVRSQPFKCPKCNQASPADTFTGHFLFANCPKCRHDFKPSPLGFILNWN